VDQREIPRPLVEPYRLLLALVCVLYAGVALSNFDKFGSPAIKALDNRAEAVGFLIGLMVAGSISLAGTLRRWPVLEAAGQVALSGVWGCFALLGALHSGSNATAFASFLAAFAIAAAWVALQVLVYPQWRKCHAARTAVR
jgi:hypothetical protein